MLFERNEMVCNLSNLSKRVMKALNHSSGGLRSNVFALTFFLFRKRVVNTDSIPNSNRTNQSLTT